MQLLDIVVCRFYGLNLEAASNKLIKKFQQVDTEKVKSSLNFTSSVRQPFSAHRVGYVREKNALTVVEFSCVGRHIVCGI